MNRGQQQGVALISVLFIVFVLVLLVSQLLTSSRQDLERAQWLQRQAQAWQYAVGGEQMARQLLHADYRALKQAGMTYSPIPGPVRRFEPERGDIFLRLADLQGRINLNNLLQDNYAPSVTAYFDDIMQQPQLTARLADWIDGDTLPRPGGGEDDGYLNEKIPFRAANRPLAHSSELDILGEEPRAPSDAGDTAWTTALNRPTPININTIKPELAPLLHPRLVISQLENRQSAEPFGSIQEVLQSDLTAGLNIDTALLTVTSSYYQASIQARFADWRQPLISRFFFDPASGAIQLLDRQLVAPQLIADFDQVPHEEVQNDIDLAL